MWEAIEGKGWFGTYWLLGKDSQSTSAINDMTIKKPIPEPTKWPICTNIGKDVSEKPYLHPERMPSLCKSANFAKFIFLKNWIMGHMKFYWVQVNRKWTSGSEPEVNQMWVESGMRGICKRRALEPCDFLYPERQTTIRVWHRFGFLKHLPYQLWPKNNKINGTINL